MQVTKVKLKRGYRKFLNSLTLLNGAHAERDAKYCAMEAVAYVAGEPHSDHPACASPVLASYVRTLNDKMNDEQRQRLKPYILRLVGTADPELDQKRAQILAWASLTEFAATSLHAIGLIDHAEILKKLTPGDWKAAYAAAYAAADAAARAAAYAADAAAYAAAYAAADAAAYAADAAARAAAYAAADAAARAAAYAEPAGNVWDMALAALDRALDVK